MAKTPPPVVPRSVNVSVVTPDETPAGAQLRTQSGVIQLRDFDRAGRAWEETYRTVRSRSAEDQEWLSRLQWFRARSKRFWIDHPLMPGSGEPILGEGRENLVRNADLSSDSDSDGVADGWSESGDTGQVTIAIV